MALFRYFDKREYAEGFLAGKIRLGTATSYRKSSAVNGDPTEGAPTLYTKAGCVLPQSELAPLRQFPLGDAIAQLGGLRLAGGARVELIPADYYLISFSKNPNLSKFGSFRVAIDNDFLALMCNRIKDSILIHLR